MSATLNEPTLSAPTTRPGVTRVAIREVREAAFRAFVAAGASSADAKVAAEQVLFTELHRGSGLAALLEDLSSGPWLRTGLACDRKDFDGRTVLRVTGPGRSGALRQGALLVDLLGAEPGSLIVSDGLTSLTPLLDEPLIRSARATGCWLVAADRSTTSIDLRVASPDGAIGVGEITTTTDLSPDPADVPLGVSLVRRELRSDWEITWLTTAEQRSTRSAAAQHGLLVDAAVWAEVKTAADAYLVPEQ